jgi:alginate O-acetyltransferase complex protein AlgI
MVFTTYIFVFYFLPLTLLVYYVLPFLGRRLGLSEDRLSLVRNAILLVASYVFYGWWNPWYVLLMLGVTTVNYVCGRVLGASPGNSRRRFWAVTAAITLSLGTLGFFKYFMFLEINANHVLEWLGADSLDVLKILLPIGISFYTFHALSYSIDVYRGTAPPARSFIDFACYIALFPQLVAGPIIRYNTVADQLIRRSHTWERFASGVALFVLGFGKKILLANPLGGVADAAFGAQGLTATDAWFGAAAYAFQIYFDFSGYSDMAVGLGRMVGFEFMKNFDSPYRAENITDFWRRWHISLSTFLRDYLYIPLGGNRLGPWRTYVNLTVVMLLGGLWHGANWTFVAWGAYHGVLLAVERGMGKQSLFYFLPRLLRVAVTFTLVLFSWVLFRSANLHEALGYLGAMFGAGAADGSAILLSAQLYAPGAMAAMVACAVLVFRPLQAHQWAETVTLPKAVALGATFCVAIVVMFAQSFNPFLYFQF